jgi:hypothetical protein
MIEAGMAMDAINVLRQSCMNNQTVRATRIAPRIK